LVENALSEVPIFGPDAIDITRTAEAALRPGLASSASAELVNAIETPLPDSFHTSSTISGKLRVLRTFVREELEQSNKLDAIQSQLGDLKVTKDGDEEAMLASNGIGSCSEIHEALLSTLGEAPGLPREAQCVVDHTMLLRARERYLFDAATNRKIVADDPWTRFAWDWVAGELAVNTILPTRFR
jgi:hypothetical protein